MAVQRTPPDSRNTAFAAVPDLTYLTSDEYSVETAPDYKDIIFKTIGDNSLKLDIYLPDDKNGNVPAVIYLHSGSWTEGSKNDIHSNAQKLVPAGFGLVSVDYRLVGDHKWADDSPWPAQGDDVADAAKFLKNHGSSYGIDPERLACWGESAGAQLCMWLASAGAVHSETRLKAAVDMFGSPCFLCIGYTSTLLGNDVNWLFGFETGRLQQLINDKDNLDAAESTDMKLVQSAEAIYQITYVSKASTPPFFIGHGESDDVIPSPKASFLASALSKVGVDYEIDIVPGGGHMYENWPDETIEKALSFLRKYLL